ncbi:hypothetical protein ACSBR1_016224 [Camellia fascicularis]
MSPKYAMRGLFSEKSDVFCFGVLLLEIVCGLRNSSFLYHEKYLNLLGYVRALISSLLDFKHYQLPPLYVLLLISYMEHVELFWAWQLCNENRASDIMDEVLADSCSESEVMRCIHHAANRLTMSVVLPMLSSEMDLPQLKQPVFNVQSLSDAGLWSKRNKICSEVSLSIIEGR